MGKSSPLNILSQKKRDAFGISVAESAWLWDSLPEVRNRKRTDSESIDQCHTGRWQGMRSRSVPYRPCHTLPPCFFTSFLSQTIWAVWVREEMRIWSAPATHWPDDKGHRHVWCNPAKRPSALLDLLLPHYRAPSYVLLTRASYLHTQYL